MFAVWVPVDQHKSLIPFLNLARVKGLSVIVWESVPGAKSSGQPIWLKLGTDVGYNEIF